MKTESLSRSVAAVALAVVCAVVWASAASAQTRTLSCQRADGTWYSGECKSSGGGGGPVYVPPPPPSPQQLADQAVREGDSYLAEKPIRPEKAIEAYGRALSHLPGDPAILRKLRRARAEREYVGFLVAANKGDVSLQLTHLYAAKNLYPEEPKYRQAIAVIEARRFYEAGQKDLKNKFLQGAAVMFRRAWELDPQPHYKRAAVEAEEALMRIRRGEKEAARGNELWKKGNYAGAIAAYEAALKHDPGAESARKNLRAVKVAKAEDAGRAFLKDKNYDAAIKAFEEALRHNPNAESAKKKLLWAKTERETSQAKAFYETRDFDSAIVKFEEAVRQNPNSIYAREQLQQARAMKGYERGRLFLEARDYDAALQAFEEAAKHRPNDKALAENVRKIQVAREVHEGEALMRRGERKLALEAFTRALAIDPNDPRAAAKLAEAESVRGAVSGHLAAVRHEVRSAVSAIANRTGRALEEARAAAELSGTPGRALVFDTVTKWVGAAGSWGPSGDTSVVAVPAKTWTPAPPERETKSMAALRGKIDRLEQEAKRAAAERQTETDSVKKAVLKEREFKAEYNAEILKRQYEKEYTSYAPLTAPPTDDAPAAAAEPSAAMTAPAGPVAPAIVGR